MDYNRAIYFKDGSVKTITLKEFEAVKAALLADQKWIQIQGCLISHDTIARVDIHHDTASAEKRKEATFESKMVMEGKSDLVDERRRLAQKIAIENAMKDNANMIDALERKSLPMSSED